MQTEHKRHIARHFNRAANTYDKAADLQREIGNILVARTKPWILDTIHHLADIGAGTGLLATPLKQICPQAQHYYLDLAYDMLQQCPIHSNTHKICADFENLPFGAHSFDFIFSNMSLQWSLNLNSTLMNLLDCLQPGGLLAISLLSAGTLAELSVFYNVLQLSPPINPFYTLDEIRDSLMQQPLVQILELDQQSYVKHYHPAVRLLHFLKNTGANYVMTRENASLSRDQYYHAQTQDLNVTFNVIYIILRKKA